MNELAPAAAATANDFAVLTPYPIPDALAANKVPNVGDGLILRAIERCVGTFAAARTFSPRVAPAAAQLAALAGARAVILAGANQLHDRWTIWPGLTAEALCKAPLRLVPFGVGVHGAPGHDDAMSPATRELLLELHRHVPLSSWRCSHTIAYLRREVPQLAGQLVLTGCPVVHDRPLLDGAPFSRAEARVAVTVTERDDFESREQAVIEFVARRFARARRFLVLHQNWSPPTRWELWRHRWLPRASARLDRWQRLRQFAVRHGFDVVCPRDPADAVAFYEHVDAHVGSRLHAHLLCLSRCKRSWLVPVDGRAAGIAADLGFPLADPRQLEAAFACDFEAVRANVRAQHPELRRFVASLPR